MKKSKLDVQGTLITILENDFISMTDIARKFGERTDLIIANWLRTRATIDFLGTWEIINNPNFNPFNFEGIRNQAGTGGFAITASDWSAATNAIGIRSKPGRYGGTYAHTEIAFEFLSYLSPSFKLYFIQEFQRLKSLENPEWDVRRSIAKVNYALHSDAIKKHIIPVMKGKPRAAAIIALAEEADMINLAVFGITAAQWRTENPAFVAKGMNIRDDADIYQLLVLANMESYNETLIHYQMGKEERFYELEKAAARQLETLYKMNQLPPNLLESPNHLLQSGNNDSDQTNK